MSPRTITKACMELEKERKEKAKGSQLVLDLLWVEDLNEGKPNEDTRSQR